MQVDALVRKPSESPEAPAEMSELEWLTKYGVVNITPTSLSIPLTLQPIDVLAPTDTLVAAEPEPSGSEPLVDE